MFVRDSTVIGVNICEDIWYPGGPVEEQVIRGGAEVILNLSASPTTPGRPRRASACCALAPRTTSPSCAMPTWSGGQDEIVFDGASLIIDEQGQVLAEGEMFAEDFLVVDVNLDGVFNARLHDPRLRKERALDQGGEATRLVLPMEGLAAVPEPGSCRGHRGRRASPRWSDARCPSRRELVAEVYDALGARYARLRAQEWVRHGGAGLSGGVDSALSACIACDAVGPRHVVGVSMPSRLHVGRLARATPRSSRARSASASTCSRWKRSSRPIARALQAPLSADRSPDVTEENLQARIRGNYLMALSNKFGWLVLTTGNKSELSVGYSTLYGDMAGGFAVLKDVYKTMVYQLRDSPESRVRDRADPRTHPDAGPRARSSDTTRPTRTRFLPTTCSIPSCASTSRRIARRARSPALGYEEDLVRRIITHGGSRPSTKRRQSPPGIKITPRALGKDRRLPITNRWHG